MNAVNPKVDFYFNKAKKWQQELEQLRNIMLSCDLAEELKWGVPCYTFQGSKIVLIHAFKEYCAVLFPKGALLKDPANILVQQTENSQAHRQIRFTDGQQIEEMQAAIKAYILEAVEVEKSGLKIAFKKTTEFPISDEFQRKLDDLPGLNKAFNALTPGRRRAYLLHFAAPKQSKTRESRVEKCVQHIFEGRGLND